jgi:hypothetical protein
MTLDRNSLRAENPLDFRFDPDLALTFCLRMFPRAEPEGLLFGKPVSTFPDHALT